MTEPTVGAYGRVFISYSRTDKGFVKKLNDALDKAGVHAWVDWEGIELASDWMQTITNSIQDSDAFLYVISPDSLKSKVCAAELELALQYNKKLIPILHRKPEKRTRMQKQLAATNWVYMRREDRFRETLFRLIESINAKAQSDLSDIRGKLAVDADRARQSLQDQVEGFANEIAKKILGRAV